MTITRRDVIVGAAAVATAAALPAQQMSATEIMWGQVYAKAYEFPLEVLRAAQFCRQVTEEDGRPVNLIQTQTEGIWHFEDLNDPSTWKKIIAVDIRDVIDPDRPKTIGWRFA